MVNPLVSATFAGKELVGNRDVCLCTDALDIVQDDRLAETGRFGEAHIAWDDSLEDLSAEVLARVGSYLAGQIQSSVVHGEQHTGDRERRVHAVLNEVHGVE